MSCKTCTSDNEAMAQYKKMIYNTDDKLGDCAGKAEGTIYYGTISHHCQCLEKTMARTDLNDGPTYKVNSKFHNFEDFKT